MGVAQSSTIKAILSNTFKNPKICSAPQPVKLYRKKCDLYEVDQLEILWNIAWLLLLLVLVPNR